MGILVCTGSLLAAPALPNATLQACVKLLAAIEEKTDLPNKLVLLPGNNNLFTLDVCDNKVSLKCLKEMMKKLEVPWNRWGAGVVPKINSLLLGMSLLF